MSGAVKWLPGKIPPGWKTAHTPSLLKWFRGREEMPDIYVFVSVHAIDGKDWLHVSISRRTTMPTYADLVYVKRHWVGEDRHAVMVLPPASEHVNLHPNCLHLFCCLDGHPLPEFSEFI